MLGSLWYTTLQALALPTLSRQLRNGSAVLCYHNVVAEGTECWIPDSSLHMPVQRFHDQMRWLAKNYELVSLREMLNRRDAGRPLRRTAAITFDDAYTGVFEHAAPLLRELGIPASVFVVTDAPASAQPFWWDHPVVHQAATPPRRRRWLTQLRGERSAILRELGVTPGTPLPRSALPADWNTIRAAARTGFDLGVHSATHRTLTGLSAEQLDGEVVSSRETLLRHTGVTPEFFAYPYGLWDQTVRAAVKAAGYRGAWSLDFGLVRPSADPWAFPRISVPAMIGRSAFRAWTAGLGPPRRPLA